MTTLFLRPQLLALPIFAIRSCRFLLLCTRTHLRFICIALLSSSARTGIHRRIYYHPATLTGTWLSVRNRVATAGILQGNLALSSQPKSAENPTASQTRQPNSKHQARWSSVVRLAEVQFEAQLVADRSLGAAGTFARRKEGMHWCSSRLCRRSPTAYIHTSI